MKLTHFLAAALLAVPFLASARPATKSPIAYSNPDGTTTTIRLHGDEFFSYTTDENCESILELDAKGFWIPAMRDGRALKAVDADIELLRSELPSQPSRDKAPARMAALDDEGRSKFPTRATDVHSPVILIEFSDIPYTIPNTNATFSSMLNDEGYSLYGSCGSVADYFRDSSNGQFHPTFDVYGPVRIDYTCSYIVAAGTSLPGAGKYGRFNLAMQNAIEKLQAQGVDFSIYDYDNDDVIDTMYFFYSGYGQADSGRSNTVWPHQGDFNSMIYYLGQDPIYFGTKKFGPYACSNELIGMLPRGAQQPYLDGIGAFCHEFSHVLGLPDLYDAYAQNSSTGSSTKVPGEWTLMCSGSYNRDSTCPPLYSAYEQWVCNWLEFEDAEAASHYTLNPLDSPDRNALRLRVRRNLSSSVVYAKEFFVVENRSNRSWDSSLNQQGALIWRIDFDKQYWTSNRVNTGGVSRVEIKEANPSKKYFTYPTPDGVNYICQGMPGYLDPNTSSKYWQCFMTDIERDPETQVVQLDWNVITEQPDMVTVMHDNPTRPETGRKVFLSWDEYPGADSYTLTITRTDANGQEYVVNNCSEYNVGLRTGFTINNISAAAFKQTFRAYVRVIKGMPSSLTSNVIEFIPQDLAVGSGVGTVDAADFEAYGLRGEIVAPEGAEVYNLSGVKTGTAGLPAGIYLVRYAGQTRKVSVR